MVNNRIIEFFGCSGVGKSTLALHLQGLLPRRVVERKEAVEQLATLSLDDLNLKENDVSFVSDLISSKGNEIIENDDFNDETKKALVKFFYSELLIDLLIKYQIDNKFVFYDDGIIHNFGKQILGFQENYLKQYFNNRDFILIEAEEDTVIEHLKSRHSENPGALNDWYGRYSGDEKKLREMLKRCNDINNNLVELAESYGSNVLRIKIEEGLEACVNQIIDFINEIDDKLFSYTINKKEFFAICKNIGTGHWASQPLWKRWDYHKEAIDIINGIDLKKPSDVLEIGTVGLQIVKGSDTLDHPEYWNFPDKSPTYTHDARDMPWPFEKKYKVIVALRVFQYLVPHQKRAFEEAKNLCDHLIIVVPRGEAYRPEGLEGSQGITFLNFIEWNNGNLPTVFKETLLGDFYYWDFSK